MLIDMNDVMSILATLGIKVTGILHVGAHQCEEHVKYSQHGINNVVWIEGNPFLAQQAKNRGFNVINAVVSDSIEDVTFNIANNGESSSILELDKHKAFYPHIDYVHRFTTKSARLDSLIHDTSLNMWNLDIQGVELRALKGAGDLLHHVDVIYTEVNVLELYRNCDKLSDMDLYLKGYGFVRLNTCIVASGWGDALYVKMR